MENLLINYTILLISQKTLNKQIMPIKIFVAAIIGAVYVVLMLLFPNLHVFYTVISKILLSINCDINFPKNIAEKRFKEEVETYSIQSKIEYCAKEQKEEEETPIEEKTSQTKVTVDTSRHLNPLLMMASHSIIRIVFEIDKNAIEIEESKNE